MVKNTLIMLLFCEFHTSTIRCSLYLPKLYTLCIKIHLDDKLAKYYSHSTTDLCRPTHINVCLNTKGVIV